MTYLPGLLVALTAFWFAMSGKTSPFFLVLAGLAVTLTLILSARLRIIGRDASPYHRILQMLTYAAWLLGEILIRTYHESQGKKTYLVGERVNYPAPGA